MRFNTIEDIVKYSQDFEHSKELLKEEGMVFTNKNICINIIQKLSTSIKDKICEPSVGKGVFIFNLFEYFKEQGNTIDEIIDFTENRLYCYETNQKIYDDFINLIHNYFYLHGYSQSLRLTHFFNNDFLMSNGDYDISLGNPPYIRIQNLDKDYLELLKGKYKTVLTGNVDIYYAFLEKTLSESKKIGFIVPNSFIKTKSGKSLRNILLDRLNYLFNFELNKVWSNVSTYTCILICGEKSENLTYETNRNTYEIPKNILKKNSTWIFSNNSEKHQMLSDLIISASGGLATLRDKIYIIDCADDEFCYKNGYRIEKDACQKYIKATKIKKFEYSYIIYPYVDSQIISEEKMEEQYPLCYNYLLSMKDELNKRDKGKAEKYQTWYAYGRKQGLLRRFEGTRFILPLMFSKNKGIHVIEVPNNEKVLVLSGILVEIKKGSENTFKEIIQTNEFYDYCEGVNKILLDGVNSENKWLSITTKSLLNYTF
jgi:adenine-specific DNA-methyltransferase